MDCKNYWYEDERYENHPMWRSAIEVMDKGDEKIDKNPVTNPAHYDNEGKQLWDIMPGMGTKEEFLGYCKYNIIKYVCRYNKKNGVQDLKKAKAYIDRMIKEIQDADKG